MRPVMLQNIDATEHGVRIQWQNEEFFTELRLQHDKQMHDLGHYGRLSFESWTSDISGRAQWRLRECVDIESLAGEIRHGTSADVPHVP